MLVSHSAKKEKRKKKRQISGAKLLLSVRYSNSSIEVLLNSFVCYRIYNVLLEELYTFLCWLFLQVQEKFIILFQEQVIHLKMPRVVKHKIEGRLWV